MAEDIWEPIRQGFKDIREGFKEARDSDLAKKKVENDRLEKAAKQAEKAAEDKRKQDYVDQIGTDGEPVFGGNVRLAQAAAAAGSTVSPYKKEKPRASTGKGYDYSFMGGTNYRNQAQAQDAPDSGGDITDGTDNTIDTAPAVEKDPSAQGVGGQVASTIRNLPTPDTTDFNFSNANSIAVLKNAQKLITNKESIPNQLLADGLVGDPAQAGAASKAIQGAENLLKITNRELSVRNEINDNYKTSLSELYKIDPGSAAKVIDNFNTTIVPELQKAGVPVDAIDGRKQEFVVNYLDNLKSSKNEADAIMKTQVMEADVFDKNFKDTEKLYKFAAITDKDHLTALLKDPNIKPYQANVLISALITRMMQDQVEAKTGKNMSVLSSEQLDKLYTPATMMADQPKPALDVNEISQTGNRIRNAVPKPKASKTTQSQDSGFAPIRR